MKIAQIVCSYPPYAGGIGNTVFELTKILLKQGNSVKVFTPFYKQDKNKNEGVEYEKPLFSFGKAAIIPKFLKQLRNFDVVHLHYPFFGTDFLVANWKKKNKDKRLVITYHMDAFAGGFKGLIFKIYNKIFLNYVLDSADCLIATTFDYVLHSSASNHYLKNKQKWVEIPLGVDTNLFTIRPRPAELKEKLQIKDNEKVILFVGGMDKGHYFKGVPILLNALKEVEQNFKCVLVGDGELKKDFEKIVDDLKLEDKIIFTGKVIRQNLADFYNLADLFVLPSINKGEAFGLVLLEAMASGVPVLASDLPGVRIIAEAGGMIFKSEDSDDLAQKIEFMLTEYKKDNLQKELAFSMNKYSWDVVVCEYSKIYV